MIEVSNSEEYYSTKENDKESDSEECKFFKFVTQSL